MYQVQHKPEALPEPRGELASRMLAMPSHTNPMGNIFGGEIMSVMDAAAPMTATKIANGTVATVFVSNMMFLEPVRVGDAICCYTDVSAIGETSIMLPVEVWVLRQAWATGSGSPTPSSSSSPCTTTVAPSRCSGNPPPVSRTRQGLAKAIPIKQTNWSTS